MSRLLRVESVMKYYGTKNNVTKAVDDISFTVKQGEFVGIMGASGSGKTTLLNLLGTIDTVSAGHIYLQEKDITELGKKELASFRRENLGFIFQDFQLLDTLTLEENIAFSLAMNHIDTKKIPIRVVEVAKKLGIEDILYKYPYEVSGGQKQRCACARAIITNPNLILADEPTGALDSKSATMLLKTMKQMNDQWDATIIMVTHDAFSASYADRILFLRDGQIFNEIVKGNQTRKQFFDQILDVMSVLGGDMQNVR
ncbi:ABC transporter ATP-binding protein [Anaerosporobacter faecicola]|uniref:ABC transporter ATP-binding protein n=1 Tax=Anaerosporobacter faecicola TaxID=2718714 RepID=UPI00143C1237|nr:ABC transporter ATP-binding protein [Anaerosporobacter faecicola]